MKLDRENSKKNIYIKDLELIENKIKKIETSNGILTITGIAADFGIFIGFFNTISSMSVINFNVASSILNSVIMMLSCIVLEYSSIKANKNDEIKKELEIKRDNIIISIEEDETLQIQNQELGKVLTKKKTDV